MGDWKFLGGGGEEKKDAKLEFPEVEEVQNKSPSWGSMDIFWNYTLTRHNKTLSRYDLLWQNIAISPLACKFCDISYMSMLYPGCIDLEIDLQKVNQ